MRDLGLQQWFENKNKRFDTKINKKQNLIAQVVAMLTQFDTASQNKTISIYYEESNVSIWNATRGHQDVPTGEGVPEIS